MCALCQCLLFQMISSGGGNHVILLLMYGKLLMIVFAITEQFLASSFFLYFFPLLISWVFFFLFSGASLPSRVQKILWVGEVGFWGEKGFLVKRFSSMGIHSHHLSCHLPSCLWNTSHGFYTLDCSCRREESSLHINYRSGKWLL